MSSTDFTVLLLAVLYFLPFIVASLRHKRSFVAIGLLNLLLGWTIVGWIGALVWAATAERP